MIGSVSTSPFPVGPSPQRVQRENPDDTGPQSKRDQTGIEKNPVPDSPEKAEKALHDEQEGNSSKTGRFSAEESDQISQLVARDSQVRSHEAAHKAAAGSLAGGGPSFSTQRGPDGRFYAVGGEVQIDTSPGSTPQETIAKARQIRAAALAPSDPSPQDLKVASAAASMEGAALREIQKESQRGEEDPKEINHQEETADFSEKGDPHQAVSNRLSKIYSQNDGLEKEPLFEVRA